MGQPFQSRKQKLLADCQASPSAFGGVVRRFEGYAQPFVASLCISESSSVSGLGHRHRAGLLGTDTEARFGGRVAYLPRPGALAQRRSRRCGASEAMHPHTRHQPAPETLDPRGVARTLSLDQRRP
jgi:hypothetical protein